MIRSTLRDAARRIQTFASRATLRELDTSTEGEDGDYWPRAKQMDVMHSESPTNVEHVQNYGSAFVPAKQDEEEQGQQKQQQQQQASNGNGAGGSGNQQGEQGEQPKGDAAEPIVMYLNGSRSHPMIVAIGDRRHQLVELKEGDVANYRLKDDRQQFLMTKDGNFISTRDDRKFRVALVPKPQSQQQQQQAPGPKQSGQQKQQKQYGQKTTQPDNEKSQVAIEQNGSTAYSRHGEGYASQKGGSDSTIHWENDKKKSSQVTEEHTHIRFKDNRIFNDKDGNWCTSPLMVKKDQYCKEG